MIYGSLDTMLHRLERLERQNRFQRRMTTLLVMVFTGLVLMGQATQPTTAKTVESEKFILKDSTGKTRAALTVDSDGTLQFLLADQTEEIRARLSVSNNAGASLSLMDNKSIVRAGLAVLADGTPDFGLADSAGVVRVGMGFDKKASSPTLVFYDSNKSVTRRFP